MSIEKFDNDGGQNRPAELDRIDALLENASSSIDKGQYQDAINDFEQVIDLTHSVFGESIELMEVRRKIKEVQQQLEEIRQNS